MTQRPFPDEWSCTAWEDCQHDGICHDPKGCGAIGPNHGCFYGMTDEEVDAAWNRRTPEPGKDGNNG